MQTTLVNVFKIKPAKVQINLALYMVTVILSNRKNIACWVDKLDTYFIVADDTIIFLRMLLNVYL